MSGALTKLNDYLEQHSSRLVLWVVALYAGQIANCEDLARQRERGDALVTAALDKVPPIIIPPAPTLQDVENNHLPLQERPYLEHLPSDIGQLSGAELVQRLLDENYVVILADNSHRSTGVAAAMEEIVANRQYGRVTHYFPEALPEQSIEEQEKKGRKHIQFPYANPHDPDYCNLASSADGLSRHDKQAAQSMQVEGDSALDLLPLLVPPTKVVPMDYQSDAFIRVTAKHATSGNIATYALNCLALSQKMLERFQEQDNDWVALRMNESNPHMSATIRDTLKTAIEAGEEVRAVITVGAGHVSGALDLNEMLHAPAVHIVPANNIDRPLAYHGGAAGMDFTIVVPDKEAGITFDPSTYPGLHSGIYVDPVCTTPMGKNISKDQCI